jgi:hypothetical protein
VPTSSSEGRLLQLSPDDGNNAQPKNEKLSWKHYGVMKSLKQYNITTGLLEVFKHEGNGLLALGAEVEIRASKNGQSEV